MNIVVIGIILTLVCVIVINFENVNAQQNNNSTGIAKLNFTKILEGKAWRHYFTPNSYNPTLEGTLIKVRKCLYCNLIILMQYGRQLR